MLIHLVLIPSRLLAKFLVYWSNTFSIINYYYELLYHLKGLKFVVNILFYLGNESIKQEVANISKNDFNGLLTFLHKNEPILGRQDSGAYKYLIFIFFIRTQKFELLL